MTVAELQAYLTKHCSPDWHVVLVDEKGSREIAYADRSGSEKMALLIPQSQP